MRRRLHALLPTLSAPPPQLLARVRERPSHASRRERVAPTHLTAKQSRWVPTRIRSQNRNYMYLTEGLRNYTVGVITGLITRKPYLVPLEALPTGPPPSRGAHSPCLRHLHRTCCRVMLRDYMCICFYVVPSSLPSLPGGRRYAHHRIKSSPECVGSTWAPRFIVLHPWPKTIDRGRMP